jgi:hypothetical protein
LVHHGGDQHLTGSTPLPRRAAEKDCAGTALSMNLTSFCRVASTASISFAVVVVTISTQR